MNATFPTNLTTIRPNFVSMVRAEIFKLTHQRIVWIMGIVVAFLLIVEGLIPALELIGINNSFQRGPDGVLQSIPAGYIAHQLMELLMNDIRGVIGIFLMVITVSAIALEYQQGTIRVLLARGVGRLRLLGAKLTAIVAIGLVALVGMLVLALILAYADIGLAFGNLDELNGLPSYFASDTLAYIGTVLISMAATILLAAAFAVLGRTLAFGLSFALLWFFVEGIISFILAGVSFATSSDFWGKIPDYFLGTNLTEMPSALIPAHGPDFAAVLVRGTRALTSPLDATHTILVTLVYCAIFLGGAVYLSWKRDVLQ